jgi:putative ABC transport system permease protein
VIPFLGWVLGTVLVWLSRLWTTRDKLLGTLGGLSWVLGGLGTVMVGREGGPVGQPGVDVGTTGPNPLELILVVAPFVLPVAAAVYLGLRLRRRAGAPATTGSATLRSSTAHRAVRSPVLGVAIPLADGPGCPDRARPVAAGRGRLSGAVGRRCPSGQGGAVVGRPGRGPAAGRGAAAGGGVPGPVGRAAGAGGDVAAATGTVAPRLAGLPVRDRWRRPAAAAAAVTSGAAVTGTVVFATGALNPAVRNLVAVGGITVGGAMTASTLAGRRFLAELGARRAEVEGKLALGATMRQATADLVQVAVAEALIPALDQTRTTGLVTLPGAFVGALFGGASPLQAARFQLVVLVGLLAAESVAAVVLLRLLANVPVLPPSTAPT